MLYLFFSLHNKKFLYIHISLMVVLFAKSYHIHTYIGMLWVYLVANFWPLIGNRYKMVVNIQASLIKKMLVLFFSLHFLVVTSSWKCVFLQQKYSLLLIFSIVIQEKLRSLEMPYLVYGMRGKKINFEFESKK